MISNRDPAESRRMSAVISCRLLGLEVRRRLVVKPGLPTEPFPIWDYRSPGRRRWMPVPNYLGDASAQVVLLDELNRKEWFVSISSSQGFGDGDWSCRIWNPPRPDGVDPHAHHWIRIRRYGPTFVEAVARALEDLVKEIEAWPTPSTPTTTASS